jgi:hypothetical protein
LTVRLVLVIAVVLLVIDALYHDGAYTQAAHRELSTAVDTLVAWIGDEIDDRAANDEPVSPTPVDEPPPDRPVVD